MIRVSSFICCRNHGKYVREAIDSVVVQTLRPAQLILINDGSDDDTLQVMKTAVEDIKELEIDTEIISREVPLGHIGSYNEAIVKCKHSLIHLMAADDRILSPIFYAEAAKRLVDEDVGFAAIGLSHMSEDGQVLSSGVDAPISGTVYPGVALQSLQQFGNFICGGGVLVKKGAQKQAGPYDPALPYSADFANWIRILRHGWNAAFIPERWYGYRRHAGAMTHGGGAPVEERQLVAQELMEALSDL